MSRHVSPLPMSDRPTLELKASFSDFSIEGLAPGAVPELETRGGSAHRVQARLEGEVTVVEVPGAWVGDWDAPRHITLRVPPSVRLRVLNEAGRIHLERLAGCDVEAVSRAGAITLDQVRGRLKLQVDTGSVRGQGLAGTFDVRSTAGSVKLGIEALDPGIHTVRTSMGSVKVELARGQAVRLETATTLGSVRNGYPSTADAPATLRLEAELGSVRVREVDGQDDVRHGDWPDWRRTWRDVAQTVADAVVDSVVDVVPRPRPPRDAPPGSGSSEEIRRVLELVQTGKVTVEDAERLIRAMR